MAYTTLRQVDVFLARNWLKAFFVKSAEHQFDKKLELLRSDLRKSEENFRQELHEREIELGTLRESVLTGTSNRRAMLDRRRFDAAERIWKSVVALAPYRTMAAQMASIDIEKTAKKSNDPKMRSFFETLIKPVPTPTNPDDFATSEQPFVTQPVWAYFSAYKTVLMYNYLQAKFLAMGFGDPNFLKDDSVKNLMKTTLPHMADYIEKNPPNTYSYMLDDIQELLLQAIRNMLDGADVDQESISRAQSIMEKTKEVQKNQGPLQQPLGPSA
jgi:hypothetical protein